MPELQVGIILPYLLRLRDGDYPTNPAGEDVQLRQSPLVEGASIRTIVQARFAHPESTDHDERYRFRVRDAEQLLRRTNRLLRWYRATSRQTEVIELTRAQASPFRFEFVGDVEPVGWTEPIEFEAAGPTAHHLGIEELTGLVRNGLFGGDEPGVADLFLIDAERALHEGRFREAVLFCWSTIDAVFNRKYESLVDAALAGEWTEARKFLTGVDLGLRHKMSAVMHLVANRSLFREPHSLWDKLTTSYNKRNAIIHRGENATEDEARLAIEVARRVVDLMNSL